MTEENKNILYTTLFWASIGLIITGSWPLSLLIGTSAGTIKLYNQYIANNAHLAAINLDHPLLVNWDSISDIANRVYQNLKLAIKEKIEPLLPAALPEIEAPRAHQSWGPVAPIDRLDDVLAASLADEEQRQLDRVLQESLLDSAPPAIRISASKPANNDLPVPSAPEYPNIKQGL